MMMMMMMMMMSGAFTVTRTMIQAFSRH